MNVLPALLSKCNTVISLQVSQSLPTHCVHAVTTYQFTMIELRVRPYHVPENMTNGGTVHSAPKSSKGPGARAERRSASSNLERYEHDAVPVGCDYTPLCMGGPLECVFRLSRCAA